MSVMSIVAKDGGKTSIASTLAGHFIGVGFDSSECEPISNKEFKMLMGIVAVSTFAFGCIVNGGLLCQ